MILQWKPETGYYRVVGVHYVESNGKGQSLWQNRGNQNHRIWLILNGTVYKFIFATRNSMKKRSHKYHLQPSRNFWFKIPDVFRWGSKRFSYANRRERTPQKFYFTFALYSFNACASWSGQEVKQFNWCLRWEIARQYPCHRSGNALCCRAADELHILYYYLLLQN